MDVRREGDVKSDLVATGSKRRILPHPDRERNLSQRLAHRSSRSGHDEIGGVNDDGLLVDHEARLVGRASGTSEGNRSTVSRSRINGGVRLIARGTRIRQNHRRVDTESSNLTRTVSCGGTDYSELLKQRRQALLCTLIVSKDAAIVKISPSAMV
jgi:hypothetical protein